jgi:hypothetical protein
MITERLRHTFHIIIVISAGLILLPFISANTYVSSVQAAHEEKVTEGAHGGGHDELPGEVPFDRPVEEIKQFIAPMNELDLFPCSDCHESDWETDFEWRDLDEPHDEIPGKMMNHDEENRWCLNCHSAKKRDKFQLQNGKMVDFNEYYRVCAQCHKRVFREWKAGVHGKRTGYWKDGEREWMHCAQCHDPHNPPFKAITPEPAPRKPSEIRASSAKKESKSADTKH